MFRKRGGEDDRILFEFSLSSLSGLYFAKNTSAFCITWKRGSNKAGATRKVMAINGELVYNEKFSFSTRLVSHGFKFETKYLHIVLKEDKGKKNVEIATAEIDLGSVCASMNTAVEIKQLMRTKLGTMCLSLNITASRMTNVARMTVVSEDEDDPASVVSGYLSNENESETTIAQGDNASVADSREKHSNTSTPATPAITASSSTTAIVAVAPTTNNNNNAAAHQPEKGRHIRRSSVGNISPPKERPGDQAGLNASASSLRRPSTPDVPSTDNSGNTVAGSSSAMHRRGRSADMSLNTSIESPRNPAATKPPPESPGTLSASAPSLLLGTQTRASNASPGGGAAATAGATVPLRSRDSRAESVAVPHTSKPSPVPESPRNHHDRSPDLDNEQSQSELQARINELLAENQRIDEELRATRFELNHQREESRGRILLLEAMLLGPFVFDPSGIPQTAAAVFRALVKWGSFDNQSDPLPAMVVASYTTLAARSSRDFATQLYLLCDTTCLITLVRDEITRLRGGLTSLSIHTMRRRNNSGLQPSDAIAWPINALKSMESSLVQIRRQLSVSIVKTLFDRISPYIYTAFLDPRGQSSNAAGTAPAAGPAGAPSLLTGSSSSTSLTTAITATFVSPFATPAVAIASAAGESNAAHAAMCQAAANISALNPSLHFFQKGLAPFDMVLQILNHDFTVLEALTSKYFPSLMEITVQALVAVLDASLFNALVQKGGSYCTVSNALSVKSRISLFEEFLEKRKLVSHTMAHSALAHLKQMADILIINKEYLIEDNVRSQVCPGINLFQLHYILTRFQPDEYSSEPIPLSIFSTLSELNSAAGGAAASDKNKSPADAVLLLSTEPVPIPNDFNCIINNADIEAMPKPKEPWSSYPELAFLAEE
eukprot:comp22060_c0_seq1/m.50991 comp22060_c0_seq1/g.50991  ORF comp22060_c0_seq1/g.50991 comp22060_c0_seq1/m.50991 type:complete len:892 (+) comp22060_c0_seq1:46-2721(+)